MSATLARVEKGPADSNGNGYPALSNARELTFRVRQSLRQTEREFYRRSLANQSLLTNLVQAERDLLADQGFS